MTILEQLAQACFHAGKPLDMLIKELVEEKYNHTLGQVKSLLRQSKDFAAIRDALIEDGLPLKTATSLVFTAQHEVETEIANEKLLQQATSTARHLYSNGNRFESVANHLKSMGCSPDLAERVALENQSFYR